MSEEEIGTESPEQVSKGRRPREASIKWPKFKSAVPLPKHMQQERTGKVRHKSNSTSSLYIKDTLGSPNMDELIRCLAMAIHIHIDNGKKSEKPTLMEIFDEEKHPLNRAPVNVHAPIDVKQIYKFINCIFKAERLNPECGILCLAYIERIIERSGLTLHPSNWKRVVLSALILASKVWEDQAVWNVDFVSVFPEVTVQDLAQLEKIILNLLGFNVSLKSSLYAKYYFELRDLAERDQRHFPLEPLSKEAAERLEKRSEDTENKARKEYAPKLQRRNSDAALKLKSPRMVLN